MLYYPKMPNSRGCPGGRCIAFEKLDGTNLHWDWDRDFGWHSFGTRRDEFDLSPAGVERCERAHPNIVGCAEVFQASLAGGLEKVFRDARQYAAFAAFRVFAEWVGPHSFAGAHRPGDLMETVLFDVEAIGIGLLGPEQFVGDFGHLRSAPVIYRGTSSPVSLRKTCAVENTG